MSEIRHYSAAEGIRVTAVPQTYFKCNRLSVNILLPLKKETAAVNALLTEVLTFSSEEYPDLRSINRKLDMLYGAKLSPLVFKIGEIQVLRMSITSIKNRYAEKDTDVLGECLEFLLSLLLKPAVKNGLFSETDVETERRNLIDSIESSINDKRAYALERLVEEMCKNEDYGVRETGSIEAVKAVTSSQLYEVWKRIIETARMEIFAVGEVDGEHISSIVSEAFRSVQRKAEPFPVTDISYTLSQPNFVSETMNVEQAKLVMGLRTEITNQSEDYLPLVYANAIFGSGVSSKLFLVVREKLHLCYYCASRLDVNKGLMLIQSGVDGANCDKAREAIIAQLEAVKNGDFTEADMSAALLSLQNGYRTVNDSPAAIENWYLRGVISGNGLTPEETAEKLAAYSKEDIVRAIQNVKLDTVYILKGRQSE